MIDIVQCPACSDVDPSATMFGCKLCDESGHVEKAKAAHWMLTVGEATGMTADDVRRAAAHLRKQAAPGPHRVFLHPEQAAMIRGPKIDGVWVDEIAEKPKPKKRKTKKRKRRK